VVARAAILVLAVLLSGCSAMQVADRVASVVCAARDGDVTAIRVDGMLVAGLGRVVVVKRGLKCAAHITLPADVGAVWPLHGDPGALVVQTVDDEEHVLDLGQWGADECRHSENSEDPESWVIYGGTR
jgi:hypothetical protein